MALTLEATALNAVGGEVATELPYVQLHSASPGGTGANECACARQAASWTTNSTSGDNTLASTAFTGGAASAPVAYVGFWSAATAGTFLGYMPLDGTSDTAFNAAGDYTLSSCTINLATS